MSNFSKNENGFTFLETLIGLSIFVSIVLPLTMHLSRDISYGKYQDKITAQCLLDQEIKIARVFPSHISPLKRRTIAGQDWEIREEASGDKLLTCTFIAKKKNEVIAQAWVMIYKK